MRQATSEELLRMTEFQYRNYIAKRTTIWLWSNGELTTPIFLDGINQYKPPEVEHIETLVNGDKGVL